MSLRSAVLSVLMLCVVLALAPAQSEASGEPTLAPRPSEELARELIAATGGGELSKHLATQIIDSIRRKHRGVPEEFWNEFLAGIDARQIEDLVVPVYVRILTVEEMAAAIEFFRSPNGQSFVRKQPQMLQQLMAAGQQWGEELGQRAAERLAKLPPGAQGVDDREAQKQTVRALRDVGTAMFAWITENGGVKDGLPCGGAQSMFGAGCPLATHAEVAAVLVPKFVAEVPEKDGWGHPYQFLFNRELSVVGIRSPGRDGKYETDVYSSSKVPPSDFDRDLVWRNGFFIRWPQS